MIDHLTLWQNFATKNNLSEKQCTQFKHYYALLMRANELFNITAIKDLEAVLTYHFQDSITLGTIIDMHTIHSIADIGTGGGFPAIPLKIIYPHLKVLLLEVSQKKVAFLQEVIKELDLQDVETCDLDWRTFLRKTEGTIDLFCARASLHPDELVRLFGPSSSYRDARLVYWASHGWSVGSTEKPFLKKIYPYTVGERTRAYALFSRG